MLIGGCEETVPAHAANPNGWVVWILIWFMCKNVSSEPLESIAWQPPRIVHPGQKCQSHSNVSVGLSVFLQIRICKNTDTDLAAENFTDTDLEKSRFRSVFFRKTCQNPIKSARNTFVKTFLDHYETKIFACGALTELKSGNSWKFTDTLKTK